MRLYYKTGQQESSTCHSVLNKKRLRNSTLMSDVPITIDTPLIPNGFRFNQKARDFFSCYFDVKRFKFTKEMCEALREAEKNAAKKLLNNRGVIYLELPDGDTALKYGDIINREEFYIEHHTVFNENSARLLAQKAGLKVLEIKSVHEPSDKYTLYAFLSPSLH